MEYLNMSLDEVIKVSRKDSNNKNDYNKKFSTNRINKKPIRKLNIQVVICSKLSIIDFKASSFKNNSGPRFNNKIRQQNLPSAPEKHIKDIIIKPNYRRLRIENLDKNIDNSELRVRF